MLAHEPAPQSQLKPVAGMLARERGRAAGPPPLAARVLVFFCLLGVVLVYALRGGSYDTVVFEEQALVIWFVLGLGVALGLLPRRRPHRLTLVVLGALTAYTVWTALSLAWTQSSELTMAELARALGFLGLVALLAFALDRATWRAAATGVAAGALLVCGLAVASRLVPSLFPSNRIVAVFHIDRLSYPFGYWNAVAAWGAMSVALGLAWSAHDQWRTRRSIVLALVPVAGTMVYLSYSRAGIGGLALAVIVSIAFTRNRLTAIAHALVAAAGTGLAILAVRSQPEIAHATGHKGAGAVFGALALGALLCAVTAWTTKTLRVDRLRLPRRSVRPLAALCAVVVLVPAVALGPHLVKRAWRSFKHQGTTTTLVAADPAARLGSLSSTRYQIWRSALHDFNAHPVGGTGAGTFEFWWNQHATEPEFVRDAHNIWLENMTELGIVGLLLIVAVAISAITLCLAVLRRAKRNVTAGLSAALLSVFAVYLLHATVDWMWEVTGVTALALAGVAVLTARLSAERLRLRWPLRVALTGAAVIACLAVLPSLLSTAEIRSSQSAERGGNASLALAWANNAVNAAPWSASAHEQRSLVLESAGAFDRAAKDEHTAASDEPLNFAHWLILARIETERSRLPAAAHDYKRAQRLRPLASVFAFAPFFKYPGAPLP
jgi:hypothetical protein